jgi:hypothetical protein
MTKIAELRQRQDQLETYVNLLESRLDAQDILMEGLRLGYPPDSTPGGEGTQPVPLDTAEVERLLKTLISKLSMVSGDVRDAERTLNRVQTSTEFSDKRLAAIEAMLGETAVGRAEDTSVVIDEILRQVEQKFRQIMEGRTS